MLLDVHSYSENNNLPFYLLHLNINSQKELANEFVLRICESFITSLNTNGIRNDLNILIYLFLEYFSLEYTGKTSMPSKSCSSKSLSPP